VAGRSYRVEFDVVSYTSGDLLVAIGANYTGNPRLTSAQMFPGRKSVVVVAGSSLTVGVQFYGGAVTATIDNISVKLLPGNHAVQATTANRPIYGIHPVGGRRNLLVRTEEFDNASWSLDNSGTVSPVVTANAAIAPDGTLTADRILLNKSGGLFSRIQQTSNLTPLPSAIYTFSVWMRKNGSGTANVGIRISDVGVNCVVTDTWQRFSVSLATAGTNAFSQILLFDSIIGNDETADIFAWGAQTETGSTATAYQRVTDQYNVTEAGVPSVSYLFFDGVNDSLATPSINFPAGPTNPTLGAELVTNGGPGFTATTSWVSRANVTVAATGGNLVGTSTNTSAMRFYVPTTTVVGRTYRVTASIAAVTGTGPSIYVYSDVGVTTITTFSTPSAGNYTFVFTATTTTSNIEFGNAANTAAGQTYSVSSVSVREIDAAYATDKMTVFAGVRKLSDASVQSLVELSAAGDSNNGAFYLRAPESAAKYSFLSRGTGNANAIYSGGLYSAPTTNVLTGIGNISGDVSTLRADGTQAATSTADQGTGTFGNYPLYIGARNSASLFFSGHLYSLIVRGAQSNTGQISSTETWVASRTGIVI
jgi:hypothetical protein